MGMSADNTYKHGYINWLKFFEMSKVNIKNSDVDFEHLRESICELVHYMIELHYQKTGSHDKLAKAMHVTPGTIYRWCNHGSIPCITSFFRMVLITSEVMNEGTQG